MESGLNSGSSFTVDYSGTWAPSGGDYFLYIRVDGLLEANNSFDTLRFTANDDVGAEMTKIVLELTWAILTDAADLYLWDDFNFELISGDSTIGMDNLSVIGITAGENIYIGVRYLPGNPNTPYSLTFTGMP